ncbi:MAG: 3-isopropylmalate dehydratase large subunit, partial [Actinobacteria bacterium]|nr:3-isopropylmalate dehydratase large subunit [Actinomycetota bacterium]
AQQCKLIRDFAIEFGIKHYFEVGRMGIEHALLPEAGLVLPGQLIIGADSHTCTYGALGALSTGVGSTDIAVAMATGKLWFMVPGSMKFVYKGKLNEWVSGKDLILYTIGLIGVDGALYKSMEFSGPVIRGLSMDSRLTMCNMAIEAGAKFGIIEVDEITRQYLEPKLGLTSKLISNPLLESVSGKVDQYIHQDVQFAQLEQNIQADQNIQSEQSQKEKSQELLPYKVFSPDSDACYEKVFEINSDEIELLVAAPHLPSNVKKAKDLRDVKVDQVVIGSCTNGRLEDLEIAARILNGKRVNEKVRAIIIPATQNIYLSALREGYIETFIEAGCVVSTPTCGPCLGGHMGVLAEGEVAVSTTNRNFVGRMGHPKSEVYLSGPAVAAASAIAGRIAVPEDIW